uniref:Calcineurin-like phosphoesterase domain-containing protein n=1 Tax=Chenopodium quinoa TaxID=63459 RepID=A0A803KS70_CHEQI
MAGVLSSDGRDLWTGGETVLIQLGDILDRGEDEIAILSLLRSLDIQARVEGGAVFQVNGNHETMNIEGDYRYVDSGGFEECVDFLEYLNECNHNWDEAFIGWNTVSERRKEDCRKYQNNFDPWNLVKVLGLFVLLDISDQFPFCYAKSCNNTHVLGQRQRGVIARSVLLQPGGRLARELARHPIVLKIHEMLEETLRALGAKAMVVGHTPQINGVNCEYNCSIWRVDVGMSSGVLDSRPEVLEINGDKARAIRSHGDASNELHVLSYI